MERTVAAKAMLLSFYLREKETEHNERKQKQEGKMKEFFKRTVVWLLAAVMVMSCIGPAIVYAEPSHQDEEGGTVSDFPLSEMTDGEDTGNGIRLSNWGGDHFAITNTQAKYFSMEADVTVESGYNPLFLIGVKDRNRPGDAW